MNFGPFASVFRVLSSMENPPELLLFLCSLPLCLRYGYVGGEIPSKIFLVFEGY